MTHVPIKSDGSGIFYLELKPGSGRSSWPTSPATDDAAINKKVTYFNDELLSHLSSLEWRRTQAPESDKELLSPFRLELYNPAPETDASTPETSAPCTRPPSQQAELESPSTTVPHVSIPAVNLPAQRRWWTKPFRNSVTPGTTPQLVTIASESSSVILPAPPTDEEKYLYASTRRTPLYLFGTFSFLSVSVGMWFFAISSNMFYWFGVFVALIQIYLTISYVVGYFGKDFDIDEYKKLIAEHSYTSDFPLVDIYLPCCKEPLEVLENTYKYVSKLEYPNYKVFVLDDGGLDSVKRLAALYNFNYISRDNKPYLKKAGNLRYAFARTDGDFFTIFDADFCPRSDFLMCLLPYMKAHEDIAIVQSPQFFRPSKKHTWVEQGASSTQELFYRIVQVNRDRWEAAICVGSNAIYRRSALLEVGGTAEIGHSEDVHTGFYASTRGWRLKYVPLALACGVCPDNPRAFFSQQMRWCSGSTTLLTNPDFWKSKLSIIQKVCYMSGMMYYTAAGLMIFLVPIPGILMLWLKPTLVMWYNFAYAFPSIIYSLIIFRLWSRQMYNFNVNYVFIIQQYAYFMAVKDRIFGTTANWVPSGDSSSHEKGQKKSGGNNKYRNMRILCCIWTFGTTGAMAAGVTLRLLHGFKWYHFLPLIILDTYNLFSCHKFIFCS
ncbi:nucleotide-diphospho-sugar transferase [Cyathus striatus]|nr:nucleotide-diphospho-sugar transferase [Cyathus striatus]